MKNQENLVRTAVDVLGGPTRVANRLGISSSTVHAWIKQGRVANFDHAETLARLSGVPAAVLRADELSSDSFDHRLAKTRLREAMIDYFEMEYGYTRTDLDLIDVEGRRLPSRKAIKAAVISLVIELELGGGSGLYELLETFLRNPDGASELEKVARARYVETLRIMSDQDSGAASGV